MDIIAILVTAWFLCLACFPLVPWFTHLGMYKDGACGIVTEKKGYIKYNQLLTLYKNTDWGTNISIVCDPTEDKYSSSELYNNRFWGNALSLFSNNINGEVATKDYIQSLLHASLVIFNNERYWTDMVSLIRLARIMKKDYKAFREEK